MRGAAMMYDKHGKGPTKGGRSLDYDDTVLIAKCGPIKYHHWARETADPDTWHEPETDWHRDWKSHFKPENTEQTITVSGTRHRMDAQTFFNGTRYAVEFQHSPISVDEIQQREAGYGNMIWMFDCVGKLDWNISNEGFVRMVWKRPRQSIFWCNCPVLLDLGTSIVQIVSMPEYKNDYWYGYECYPDEMQITLTTGDFIEGRTTALKQLIEEGAA
jgi:hypothetical protein